METVPPVVDETQPLLGNESLRYDDENAKTADVVDFDPNGDEENPMDWPKSYKWGIVALLAFMAFTVVSRTMAMYAFVRC